MSLYGLALVLALMLMVGTTIVEGQNERFKERPGGLRTNKLKPKPLSIDARKLGKPERELAPVDNSDRIANKAVSFHSNVVGSAATDASKRRAFKVATKNAVDIVFTPGQGQPVRFTFQKILIVKPTDVSKGYQKGVDTLVREISFKTEGLHIGRDVDSTPPTCTRTAANADGNREIECTAALTSLTNSSHKIFKLTSVLASTEATVDNGVDKVAQPSRTMKFAVEINIDQVLAADEYVVLVLKIRAAKNQNTVFETGAMQVGSDTKFEWESQFIGHGGKEGNVIVPRNLPLDITDTDSDPVDGAKEANKRDRAIYYLFNEAGTPSVYWDPAIGEPASDTSNSALSMFTVIGIAVGATALVSLMVLFLLQRKEPPVNKFNSNPPAQPYTEIPLDPLPPLRSDVPEEEIFIL